MKKILAAAALALACFTLGAQKYNGLIDKTVAVIGGEFVTLSELEQEVNTMRARGYASDQNIRCEILENILQTKLLLMQARVDSLTVNKEMVGAQLNQHIDEIRTANAVVAIAGMEGALGGVIAGLVSVPVIAVPTSVGYGASFAGIAPLLTMLNSCAEGMSVVNIDNGFGAGYLAARINSLVTQGNHP